MDHLLTVTCRHYKATSSVTVLEPNIILVTAAGASGNKVIQGESDPLGSKLSG